MEQLLKYFTPTNYQLDLIVDKSQKKISGIVTVTGNPSADTIKFHAVNMDILSVEINGTPVQFIYENNEIILKDVQPSEIVVKITYTTPLNSNMVGAYLSTYKHEGKVEQIVATQFESHYARECFPCIDEPAAKATFDLSLTTPDNGDTVLSNTPVKSVEKSVENSTITTTFETTPRMSTYLLAFVIGKFQSKSIKNEHGVQITSYCALNHDSSVLDFANEVAARSLDYYDDKFGIPYPLKKLDQVALPDFDAGAMENWGLVTYRESCMLVNSDSAMDAKKHVALTIAHELSHQWFGDLVTMQWWDDLWLNESFASVMEYFAVDALYPDFHIWEDFFTGDCLSALRRDCLAGVQAVKQPVNDPEEINTLFDPCIVYAKGARLMLMLIRLMGEKRFFAGIKDYFEKYKYNNTIGDNLWDTLSKHSDFGVKKFMNSWISQPGLPVVTDGVQQRFSLSPVEGGQTWPIPEITDDMSGHYLIDLSGPEFAKAMDDFDNLSLEQRLRLLIDRSLLAKTPIVSSASLLDILPKFKNETSAPIWGILSTIISDLKLFIPTDSAIEAKFKEYIYNIVAPTIERLGLTRKPGESSNDTDVRNYAISLAEYADNQTVLETLAGQYNDDYSSLDSELRGAILFAKLRLDESVFDKYLEQYQSATDPDIRSTLLFTMATTRDDNNINKLIALLTNPKVIKPQDHLFLYIYLRRNSKAKTRAIDWLFSNWDYVERMTGGKSIEDYPQYTASTIKTRVEMEKFFDFFTPFKNNPTYTRVLDIARTEIASRIALIESDQKAIFSRFKQ